MMIVGVVSGTLVPQVQLTLVGAGAEEIEIQAAVDSCFNSGLSLSAAMIEGLGWQFDKQNHVKLGDGSEPMKDFFRGIVMWHGQPRLVDVLSAESGPLIGSALLDGNKVEIEFKRGGKVTITPLG